MSTAPTPLSVNPFLALRPFKRADAASFFGRGADLVLIQSRLFSSRCTLLFAAAGVGKSSFLDAKLGPAVESQWVIVTHRSWAIAPPLAGLQASVAAKAPDAGDELDLVAQVERLVAAPGESRGCLVVLDQFEEVFQHWRDSKALDEFASEIARLVHTPGLEARVLISMREEFLGELSLFDNLIPDLFNNCYRLKNATLSEAEEIITRTAMLCGAECGPGLDALLVDLVNASSRIDAARRSAPSPDGEPSPRGRIPMPFLQIVCYRLWKQQMLGARPHKIFLEETPGPVRDELEAYCREKLKALSAPEQDLAAAAFGFLMTRSGAKMAYPIDVLAQQAHVNEAALLAVLKRLAAEDVRILRDIPAGPNQKPWFELYHDLYSRFLSEWKRDHDFVREMQLSRKSLATVAALVIASALVVAGLTWWRAAGEKQRQFADQLQHIADDQRTRDLQETPLSLRLRVESFLRNPDQARAELRRALESTLIEIGRIDISEEDDLVAVSPNGQVLCVVESGAIRLRRLPEGTPIGDEVKRATLVAAVAFSPDGTKLAAAGWDGKVEIISTADARPIASIEVMSGGLLNGVAFSADGKMIAASGESFDDTEHLARVYAAAAPGEPLATVTHRDSLAVMVFSPNGRYLLTGSDDGSSHLTDLQTGERTTSYHQTKVVAAAFRPDSGLFATAGADGITQTTTVPGGSSTVLAGQLSESTNALAFSPSGRYLATGQGVLWDLTNGQGQPLGTGGGLTALAFAPDEQLVAAAGTTGAFIVATGTLKVLADVSPEQAVRVMALAPQGDWLIIAVRNTLRLFRVRPAGQTLPANDGELQMLACKLADAIDPGAVAKYLGAEQVRGCRE